MKMSSVYWLSLVCIIGAALGLGFLNIFLSEIYRNSLKSYTFLQD